ncbi:DUF817 domain-containing protein [Paenibacillus kobensis]|uniref:DUF817 domain-containing protein n=1 Tax=Paenibacillus kobensis TaxID=59841 RepID=UPI000FD8E344|nr:DUF817 domain-containing protein [Paenibacillus kobensis]
MIRQLIRFGWMQALNCMFAVIIFAAMALTRYVDIPYIPRYDAILIVCLLMQVLLIWTKLETVDELKVIIVFHLLGLALETYKVHMGSWSYPDEGYTKLAGVPLYSGFMYASVASYICQAYRRFQIEVFGWPPAVLSTLLSAAIYLNFFTHHWLYDVRYWLMLALVPVFGRSSFRFTVGERTYSMPVIVSYLLIGFFIWIAENISTFLGAWKYPNQEAAWHVVHWGKIGSWFLLVIISVIIVTELKRLKGRLDGGRPTVHLRS